MIDTKSKQEKPDGWMNVNIFGAWAYKIKGKVDYSKPFPPFDDATKVKHIDMRAGEYTNISQLNENLLNQWIEWGATHIMLCNGDGKARVITVANLKADKEKKTE